MSSNPAPRPALTRTDAGLTRPALRRPDGATPLPPEPELAHIQADEGPKSAEKAAGKPKKAKHGQKDGRDYKDTRGSGKKPETVDVTVTLTKQSRRALKDAAQEREMTPEDLASLVLSAWLDR